MKNQNYVNYMASDGSHQQEPFKKKWFIRYLNLAGIFPSGSGGFLGHKDAIRLQRRIYQRICFQLLHLPDSFHQIRCPFEVFWQYERLLIGIQQYLWNSALEFHLGNKVLVSLLPNIVFHLLQPILHSNQDSKIRTDRWPGIRLEAVRTTA